MIQKWGFPVPLRKGRTFLALGPPVPSDWGILCLRWDMLLGLHSRKGPFWLGPDDFPRAPVWGVGRLLRWVVDPVSTVRCSKGKDPCCMMGVAPKPCQRAEDPPSRTRRLVTNLQLLNLDGDDVTISCNFQLYRTRLNSEEDSWIGRREDVLRRENGQFKLARRYIYLEQTVILSQNLSSLF